VYKLLFELDVVGLGLDVAPAAAVVTLLPVPVTIDDWFEFLVIAEVDAIF
jgi:hypothetical protein